MHKNFDIIKSLRRMKLKRQFAVLITLLMFFSGIPDLSGIVSYAAVPSVQNITIQTLSSADKVETKVTVNGSGLIGATVRINNTNLSSITGVKINNKENGYYEAVFPANQGFNFINGSNSLQVTTADDAVSRNFNMSSPLPTLSGVNRNVYVGKQVVINGNNLSLSYANSSSVKLFIGLRENAIDTITTNQIVVDSLDSQTGDSYDVEYQISYNAPAADGVPSAYSYILKDSVYPLKIIEGLENLRITPSKGPIRGGTVLSINAVDTFGNIITGQDLFKDGMTVQLRGAEPSNKAKLITIPANQIEVIRTGPNGTGLTAVTPDVSAQTGVTGKYDVVIKQGTVSDAEAVALEGFEYLSTMPSLDLRSIRDTKGKDTGDQAVILEGENIIDIESLGLTIEAGGSVSIPTTAIAEDGKLKILYEVTGTPGAVKYGDFVISPGTIIERTVEVKIGNTANAIAGNIGTDKPVSIPQTGTYTHYMESRGGKSDGVFFKTPSVNADTVQKYDVELETRTYITINGNVKLPVIIERDKLLKGFEYIRTKINPKVTSIEPAYGYYSKLEDDPLVKPLVVRIKGSGFQVEKKEIAGELESVYPEIRLTKLDGLFLFGINPDRVKVDVKKVLIGDRPVDGESDKYGDTIIAEIYPVDSTGAPDPSFKLNEESGLWTNDSLFKRLRTRFLIEQTSGDNSADTSTDDQPYLEFRYPLSVSTGNIQPVIENVYQNGFPVTSLSSDIENELEIKFKAANVTDLNSVVLTLDGIDLGKAGRITARKLDGDFISIKFKTPRNIMGNARLQVIVREGLMDSFDDLFFSPISGPVLKNILPSKGQRGTWTVIKRDSTLAQSARFKLPDETNADGSVKIESGSRIIYNGVLIPLVSLVDDSVAGNYEVKDIDTIVFKIPESSNTGSNIIQVENPSGGRSQGLVFEVVNPATPTGIASIDPDKGDRSGGITATIKAKPGTSFAGEVDVYLGSQKAPVTGYNIGYSEVYIKVPEFIEKTLAAGESYSVPVTAVNKERFSSDTLINGYTYINPSYKVEITSIFKEGSEAETKNAGLAGDSVVIEGKEIRAVRQSGEVTKLPLIYFGNTKAEILSWDITPGTANQDSTDSTEQIVNLDRIKVKAPVKPNSASADGSVTVMLINPDGATAIKEKGFIYTSGKPEIVKESSTLTASRFHDTINVFAKDVYKDGLIAAFGDKTYTKDLSTGVQEIVTDNEQEKLLFTFDPAAEDNVSIQYQYIEGSTVTAIDFDAADIYDYKTSQNIADSSVNILLGEENERLIGIKWNKEKYHKAVPFTNSELLSKLNDEIISIKIVKKPESTMNQLVVRRGLGKIASYQLNAVSKTANIRIETPYNDRPEKTRIYLINSDESFASSDFEFTGGTDTPEITEVAGTKSRQITLNDAIQTSKVFTQDVNLENGVIKISGKNFLNIKSVRIGGTALDIEAVSPDADWILAKVKKGDASLVQKPQVISVTTASGTALSDAATVNADKIYFMYISAGSSPVIKSVSPDKGITTGGNRIKITGEGFSNKDEFGTEGTSTAYQITVNINGANAAINSLEKDANGQILSLSVTAPEADPGKAVLTLINGDGGSATAPFEYISQPKIASASTSTGKPILFNDENAEITLTGEEFQTGAKVYIGSVISDKKTEGAIKVAGIKGLTADKTNKEVYVTGGYEAGTVTFINSKTIKFKMPTGLTELENKSIIVVNPDTGVSDGFEDGSIKPPVPDVPDIEAIPGYERSMILKWNVDKETLNAAEKFEIYARQDGRGDYLFVGDTKGTQFTVKSLKADTRYQFKVRVLNKYGSAEDVGYVSEKTLRASQDYKEKDKIREAEKAVDKIQIDGKSQVVGNALVYTVGSSESYISLKDSKQTEKSVLIAAEDIRRGNKTLTIEDKDMTLTIPYSSLNVSQIMNASKSGYMRIKISSAAKQMQESIKMSLPRSMTLSSSAYYIGFEAVDGTSTQSVTQLSSNIQLFIRSSNGRGSMYRYDEATDSLISETYGTSKGGYYVLVSPK